MKSNYLKENVGNMKMRLQSIKEKYKNTKVQLIENTVPR